MKNKKKILLVSLILVLLIIVFCLVYYNKLINKTKYSTMTTESIDILINTDDGDEKINWNNYKKIDYNLTQSLTINEGGVYNLTGDINDGLIIVNTLDNVKLVLNNIKIKNSTGPAIYIENVSDVVIELADNSNNYLEDSSSYNGYDSKVIGTIFSHDDITFQGNGNLTVISNNEDAIVGKDDIKFVDGNYKIISRDDGIRGKDSVYIKNGNFNIKTMGVGVKSTNDIDVDKGYILIENGSFDIESILDGIDSKTKLLIKDGQFNIKTKEDSLNSSSLDIKSAKGLKCEENLVIEGGTFSLDTVDNAINCNNYIGIKNGILNITSSDKGIHADSGLIIDNGKINIRSYEGIVASSITINGGNINIDSLGNVIGINGSVYQNAGDVVIGSDVTLENIVLENNKEFVVNGGSLIVSGLSDMVEFYSKSSKVYNILINFNTNYDNSDIVTITDKLGDVILSYQSDKSYNSLVVASSKFEKGESYTIRVNEIVLDKFTISGINTRV